MLPKYYSGFCKNYSTTTALLQILKDVHVAFESSFLVLPDFSKSFNISETAFNLLQNYLVNRIQSVFIPDHISSWCVHDKRYTPVYFGPYTIYLHILISPVYLAIGNALYLLIMCKSTCHFVLLMYLIPFQILILILEVRLLQMN